MIRGDEKREWREKEIRWSVIRGDEKGEWREEDLGCRGIS